MYTPPIIFVQISPPEAGVRGSAPGLRSARSPHPHPQKHPTPRTRRARPLRLDLAHPHGTDRHRGAVAIFWRIPVSCNIPLPRPVPLPSSSGLHKRMSLRTADVARPSPLPRWRAGGKGSGDGQARENQPCPRLLADHGFRRAAARDKIRKVFHAWNTNSRTRFQKQYGAEIRPVCAQYICWMHFTCGTVHA